MDRISVNPFVARKRFAWSDYFGLLLASPLVGLRLLVIGFLLCPLWVITFTLYHVRNLHNPRDYNTWRTAYTCVPLWFVRAIYYVCGIQQIDLHNCVFLDEQKEGTIQILVPHTSVFDTSAIPALGYPPFVAIPVLKANILSKYLVELANPIIVNKEDQFSRRQAKDGILERGHRKEPLIIFPEGSCGNGRVLLKLKPGAFTPGQPVKPIILKSDFTNGWTWDGISLKWEFFLFLTKWKSKLELIGLPLYFPSEEEINDARLYAENVEKYIESKSDLRFSFYNCDDGKFLFLATEFNLPRSPSVLKLLHLCWKIVKHRAICWSKQDTDSNNNYTSNGRRNSRTDDNGASKYQKFVNSIEKWFQKKLAAGYGSLNSGSISFLDSLSPPSFSELAKLRRVIHSLISTGLRYLRKTPDQHFLEPGDILRVFQVESKLIENSTLLNEFWNMLRKGTGQDSLSHSDFAVLLTLCNMEVDSLWQRIRSCFTIFDKQVDSTEIGCLSESQFKILIWFLLGIREDQISLKDLVSNRNSNQSQSAIDFDYIKGNLVRDFRLAVEENASILLRQTAL